MFYSLTKLRTVLFSPTTKRQIIPSVCFTNSALPAKHDTSTARNFIQFCDSWPESKEPTLRNAILNDLSVYEHFLSDLEEESLLKEVDPYLRKMRYEYDHWDNVIHGYRETERSEWSQENNVLIDRVKKTAFNTGDDTLHHVHILDLSADGHIKPHVDAVRYCGSTIAGLCLLSAAVMRLCHTKEVQMAVDVLLPRRCLYVISGAARYDFNHEVLEQSLSRFRGKPVIRERRISVICRNAPQSHHNSDGLS